MTTFSVLGEITLCTALHLEYSCILSTREQCFVLMGFTEQTDDTDVYLCVCIVYAVESGFISLC